MPDLTHVLADAWKLVDRRHITEEDFRAFTFANPVMLHARMNPNFFKGTAVEGAVAKLMAEEPTRPASVA
ncbi:hypothetical protein D3C83_166240 [compost metagenome]